MPTTRREATSLTQDYSQKTTGFCQPLGIVSTTVSQSCGQENWHKSYTPGVHTCTTESEHLPTCTHIQLMESCGWTTDQIAKTAVLEFTECASCCCLKSKNTGSKGTCALNADQQTIRLQTAQSGRITSQCH